MTTRVGVVGASGKLGTLACRVIEESGDLVLAAKVLRGDPWPSEQIDVLLDVASPESARQSLEWGRERSTHVVIGATGLDAAWLEDFARSVADSEACFAVIPNFSLSAALLMEFARQAASAFESVEIIEGSHPAKKEAPSGTAVETARVIGGERGEMSGPDATTVTLFAGARGGRVSGIPVHSLRMSGMLNEQKVLFGNPGEQLILEFGVFDRVAFGGGILRVLRGVQQHRGFLRGLGAFL